jgi:histidinol dehydrogenase
MSFSKVTSEGFEDLASKTLVLAKYEGFPAHAAALTHRLGKKE